MKRINLIVLAFCSIMVACSTEATANHIYGAVNACKDRGGVDKMWSDLSSWHAVCVDGTRVYKVGDAK